MALNISGALSLAGTTLGQSIQLELGGNGTTQISLNDLTVRNLAGIPSGAIALNNFYGKSRAMGIFYGGYSTALTNTVTRINACGALVGSETAIGTARYDLAGASVGFNGLFYGGSNGTTCLWSGIKNLVTRINSCGALVGSETSIGTPRMYLAGALVGSNGLFHGGAICCFHSLCIVTRINACGALVGSQTNTGSYLRHSHAAAKVGSNGLFYGGRFTCFYYDGCGYPIGYDCNVNTVARINACGALVGSQTSVGSARDVLAGASVGSNGLFYGGCACYPSNESNLVTRINACGALVGSQTSVGSARSVLAGASVESNSKGLFYGGFYSCHPTYTVFNRSTRINACGALVGEETNIGTARADLAGAGF
jgi:hypothetical protein